MKTGKTREQKLQDEIKQGTIYAYNKGKILAYTLSAQLAEAEFKGIAEGKRQAEWDREKEWKNGYDTGKNEAIFDAEQILFDKVFDYKKIKKFGKRLLIDGRQRTKEAKGH
jgi:hypothetical protein